MPDEIKFTIEGVEIKKRADGFYEGRFETSGNPGQSCLTPKHRDPVKVKAFIRASVADKFAEWLEGMDDLRSAGAKVAAELRPIMMEATKKL